MMKNSLNISIVQTKDYPTRYTAFDNPKKWAIADLSAVKKLGKHGNYEAAVYYEPMTNDIFPYITDGIYIEIGGPLGRDTSWRVDCHATIPNRFRRQKNLTQNVLNECEAFEVAKKFIDKARAFCSLKTVHCDYCKVQS